MMTYLVQRGRDELERHKFSFLETELAEYLYFYSYLDSVESKCAYF